jgi:tRNA A37 N6-isopentenylltransferase MiaA
VTNKVTPAERASVPHHLIDFLDPLRSYNVLEFRTAAVPVVERLRGEGKVPVLVGGTNYYVEAVLFKSLSDDVAVAAGVRLSLTCPFVCVPVVERLRGEGKVLVSVGGTCRGC